MRLTVPEVFNRLNRMRDRIHKIFRSHADANQRAADVAGVVQLIWPGAAMHMAMILDGRNRGISVRDRSGRDRPDWAKMMCTTEIGDGLCSPGLPPELESNRGRLVWEDIVEGDRRRGGLGVCVSANLSADRQQILHLLL